MLCHCKNRFQSRFDAQPSARVSEATAALIWTISTNLFDIQFCSTHLPSRGLFFYLARTPHSTDAHSLSLISPPAFRHRSLKGFALVAFIASDSIKHRWAETKENEEVKEGERARERQRVKDVSSCRDEGIIMVKNEGWMGGEA